jgi:hypothetical protein
MFRYQQNIYDRTKMYGKSDYVGILKIYNLLKIKQKY